MLGYFTSPVNFSAVPRAAYHFVGSTGPIRYFLPLVIRGPTSPMRHAARSSSIQIGVVATAIVFGYGRSY